MLALLLHPDAQQDLANIRIGLPRTADKLVALLEEIKGDPSLMSALLTHGFGADHDQPFKVSKFVEQWRAGLDLWALKFWELEDLGIRYRIVYCYMPDELVYYVLGIVHRSFNYDKDHDVTKRILKAYADLH